MGQVCVSGGVVTSETGRCRVEWGGQVCWWVGWLMGWWMGWLEEGMLWAVVWVDENEERGGKMRGGQRQ